MARTITEQQRQRVRRAIRRATLDLSYDRQRVARWIEEAVLKQRPIDIRAGASSLHMSFQEFYELTGRVMNAMWEELRDIDLDL